MGNKMKGSAKLQDSSASSKFETQLAITDLIEENAFQENQQKQRFCLCYTRKKIVRKKISWETKFISNCQELRADSGYEWIDELIKIVRNNQLPRVRYLKEVHNLRKEKPETLKIAENEKLCQQQEIEKFKKNLKKSVIVSLVYNRQSTQLPSSSMRTSFIVKKNKVQTEENKKRMFKSGIYKEKRKAESDQLSKHSRSSSFQQLELEGAKQVSKKAATELQIFLKLSSILQRHLSDMSCILGRLRKQFVYSFQQNFKATSTASKQLDTIIQTVQIFLTILQIGVMDYYNLSIFGKDEVGSNMFISSQQNIGSTCTAIMFKDHQFYNCLFSCISQSFKQRESRFSKILNYLSGSGPERFQVKDKFCLNVRTIKSYLNHLVSQSEQSDYVQNIEINDVVVQNSEPYKACMIHLNQMVKSRSPINKLKCLMACSEGITVQIQKFYDLNSLRKQKWMLDADQMLSIFCYLIVGARVEHLHTHLFLLDNFASSLQRIEMTGYYLSVMNCAVQHLENQFGKEVQQLGGIN